MHADRPQSTRRLEATPHLVSWSLNPLPLFPGNKRAEQVRRLKKNHGFTLLELIIVIFLVMLVLGLSTSFFAGALSSSKLSSTARDLSATIRYARSLAQIHGEKKVVTIDLDSKFFGIEGKGNKGIPADISAWVVDPLLGEIRTGKYQIVLRGAGGIEGGTVMLSYKKKTVSIVPDPVVGSVVVK